jgi:hypothetical protein
MPLPDDDKQPDIMPDPIDDGQETGAGQHSQDQGDEGGDNQARQPIEPKGAFDDSREALVAAYRAQRAKGKPLVAPDPEQQQQDEGGDEPPAQQARQQQEPRQEQRQQQEQDPPPVDDPEFPLVIHGRVVKKKLSEIVRHAQRDLAADDRLGEAKRLVEEARALRADPNGSENPPAGQGQRGGSPQQTTESSSTQSEHPPADVEIEEELLDRVAQNLQVGDQSDGREALRAFAKTIIEKAHGNTSRAPDEDAIRAMTRRELQEAERQREIDAALTSFSTNFSHIVQDDDLTEVAQTRLKTELREDLKRAGVAAEDLDRITDPAALAHVHRNLRMQGARLRTYEQVLNDVGNHLTSKFGKPAGLTTGQQTSPARSAPTQQTPTRNVIAERQDMKRNAPQQPRAAGVRGTAPSQQQKAPRSRLDIIAEMRQRRGFN